MLRREVLVLIMLGYVGWVLFLRELLIYFKLGNNIVKFLFWKDYFKKGRV